MVSSCKNKNESQDSMTQTEQRAKAGTSTVIFENEFAKVLKITLGPDEFLDNHEGENRVIYSLTNYSLDWEENGEKLGTKTWKAGDAHFHEAGRHAAKNNGTTIAEWLVFSKKNADLPDCEGNTVENDVNSVSPEFAQILIDNDDFKITEVKLPFGEKIPSHSGINRIIYSLSGYDLKYESDKEAETEKYFEDGDIHWHDACHHSLENVGETEARFLVVSYKQNNE
jgi:hypothetical protein